MMKHKELPREEKDITPAMIDAGLTALEWYQGSYASADLVSAIYKAMREASLPVRPKA